jgi:uncharacterized protein (DUF1684 family)
MVKESASISIILLSYFAATALAGAQAMPRAVRVSRDYSAGLMMKHVPPEYPVDAKKHVLREPWSCRWKSIGKAT